MQRLAASLVGAILIGSSVFAFAAQEAQLTLALSDFFLIDTSGEPRDQTAEHNARLARFDSIMRDELSRSGRFTLLDIKCPQSPCSAQTSSLDQLRAAAKDAGARFLVAGAVEKMSTLVLWVRFEVYDVGSGQLVFNRLLTFRGDNDDAWRRAANYAARELIKNAPAS